MDSNVIIYPEESLAPLPAAWECELASETLRWAPGVFALFGLAPGMSLRRADIVGMYAPQSRALLEQLRAEALEQGLSFTFEAEIRRPSGEPRWMRVTADVVRTHDRMTHLYGTKQDITHEMISRG